MRDVRPDDDSADEDLVIDGSESDEPIPVLPRSGDAAIRAPAGVRPEARPDRFRLAAILIAHYKNTYGIVLRHGRARDRFFLYILLLLALIAIDGLSRGTLSNVINGYAETHLVANRDGWQKLDFTAIIHLLVDFCLLSLVLKYYQRTMLTTRAYNYLIRLEEQICEALGGPYVTRHGRAYYSRFGVPNLKKKERQPYYLRFARFVYDGVFPMALGALAIWMFLPYVAAFETVWHNVRTMTYDPATIKSTVSQVGSGICTLGIAFSSLLYLVWIVLRR